MARKPIKDINALVNDAYKEVKGTDAEITTDGVVSIGQEIASLGSGSNAVELYEPFFKALWGRVAKTIFDDRIYVPQSRNMTHDEVEWGRFIRKVYIKPIDAVENPEYISEKGHIVQKSPYDITTAPEVLQRVNYNKSTYAYEYTVALSALKDAFLGEEEMGRFLSSIETSVRNKMSIDGENIANTGIAYAITNTFDNGKKVMLLTQYNAISGTTLTAEQALRSKDFLKYAYSEIMRHIVLMQKPTNLYTIEDFVNFTLKEDLVIEMLDSFARALKVNMESEIFHRDLVAFEGYSSIPYWQSTIDGTDAKAGTIKLDTHAEINNVVCYIRDNNHFMSLFSRENQWSKINPRANHINYGINCMTGYGVDNFTNSVVFLLA